MATSNFESDDQDVPFWLLAKKGIRLLINNNVIEAQQLFASYPDNLLMLAGYSFAVFMDALMTFEEDKLNLATIVLKDVERRCSSESGWFKSVKKAFSANEAQMSLCESLETQIILADSQVCLAILTFLQQDISGYFKGSWVLRKAWKVYETSFQEILQLYKDVTGETVSYLPDNSTVSTSSSSTATSSPKNISDPVFPSSNGYQKIPYSRSAILSHFAQSQNETSGSSTNKEITNTSTLSFLRKSFSVNSALSRHTNRDWGSFPSSLSLAYLSSTLHLFSGSDKLKPEQLDVLTIKRLLSAVSFGYGLFQLGMSLLPPSLLKLTHFFGFGGNRKNGIACLMYARNGIDMRAPLATLSLLWYHTIVRPFYALDGSNVQAGVDAACQLLQESESEFGQSALHLFFKGRVSRLDSDIPAALQAFQLSVENASQREIKILALHEVGWCHLIQLDYCNAEETFTYLKSWSRWSRAFYGYLAGICCGSCATALNYDNIKEVRNGIGNGIKLNPLEEFLTRRAKYCPSDDTALNNLPKLFWRLLVFEMLYLWNALPSCSPDCIHQIIQDCEAATEDDGSEPMLGLRQLILGCCYCIQKQTFLGIAKFRLCLEKRQNLSNNAVDAHISAFSQYELGALLIKCDETLEEGKLLLQDVNHYKDYDFQQRLSIRVHSILKRL